MRKILFKKCQAKYTKIRSVLDGYSIYEWKLFYISLNPQYGYSRLYSATFPGLFSLLAASHSVLLRSIKVSCKLVKLQFHYEGAGFMDKTNYTWNKGTPAAASTFSRPPRSSGCQMCHGTTVELGPDNKPINETWPGGVGTRYPDGSIGTCTVCHTRHKFSISDARKPEACGACHLGPDHPNIEIYNESKHGQNYLVHGDEWNYDSPSGAWEPGDYTAPTCATCHMSGIGDLATTHNVQDRLKWDLMHKKSVVRSGERGNGEKGEKLMRKVCANCHGPTHVNVQRASLDNSVELYNKYWAGAVKMKNELKKKGLLG